MDLIGFIVAGHGVHHDVDAGAKGHFPLGENCRTGPTGSMKSPSSPMAQAAAQSFAANDDR